MKAPVQPWRDHLNDERSNGSMAQFAREFLSRNPKGWTRSELKEVLKAHPVFWRQFERNPGAYPNMVRRLLLRGDILEREGLLFASKKTQQLMLARSERFQNSRDL